MVPQIRHAWLLALCLLIGCGLSARQKTLREILVAVDTARTEFVLWDDQSQIAIVNRATTLEAGQAKLAIHREKRDLLVSIFEATYRSLALAIDDPTDDGRLAGALRSAEALWAAYSHLTGFIAPHEGE